MLLKSCCLFQKVLFRLCPLLLNQKRRRPCLVIPHPCSKGLPSLNKNRRIKIKKSYFSYPKLLLYPYNFSSRRGRCSHWRSAAQGRGRGQRVAGSWVRYVGSPMGVRYLCGFVMWVRWGRPLLSVAPDWYGSCVTRTPGLHDCVLVPVCVSLLPPVFLNR